MTAEWCAPCSPARAAAYLGVSSARQPAVHPFRSVSARVWGTAKVGGHDLHYPLGVSTPPDLRWRCTNTEGLGLCLHDLCSSQAGISTMRARHGQGSLADPRMRGAIPLEGQSHNAREAPGPLAVCHYCRPHAARSRRHAWPPFFPSARAMPRPRIRGVRPQRMIPPAPCSQAAAGQSMSHVHPVLW